jgi:predicted RNA-binding Zn ribbon-like protein
MWLLPARGGVSSERTAMAASDYVFDLDGGRACLDFANTLSSSGDHLSSYADLVAFAEQSHLLTPEDANWLRADAKRDAASADRVLVRAKRLRASIYAIFAAIATGERPPQQDVSVLNFDLAVGMAHARVLPAGPAGAYRWGFAGRNLDAPLWPITRSAADLLTSDAERRLVRECGSDTCHWLFLDTSKNRTRQWCSMQSCGNREKARRHYRRVRGHQSGPAGRSDQGQAAASSVRDGQGGERG